MGGKSSLQRAYRSVEGVVLTGVLGLAEMQAMGMSQPNWPMKKER